MDSDSARVSGRHLSSEDNLNESIGDRLLDNLSDLDRHIIVALQQDGRANWTSIADAVGSSVATVTRRGQQLISDGVVRIAVMPATGSTGRADLFMIRINCAPGTIMEVAAELVARADVRFLSMVTGQYDIVAELVVHSGASHYPRLVSQLQSVAGIERWRSDLLMHVYKVGHDWSRQLFAERLGNLGPEGGPVESREPVHCDPSHFDQVDWQILSLVRGNGRMPFNAIARELGVNESSVRRRFDRMRQNGCIDVFTLVSAPALGMGAETLLTVQVQPGLLGELAAELARYSAVRYLAATLDNNSLWCEVIAVSNDALYHFITDTLAGLGGVLGWEAAMELLSLKRGYIETPWWRQYADH